MWDWKEPRTSQEAEPWSVRAVWGLVPWGLAK